MRHMHVHVIENSSPLPPFPRFPDCKCQRDRNMSPYRAQLVSATPYVGGTKYCWKFNVVACEKDNPCCYMNLYKLEFPFGEAAAECWDGGLVVGGTH